jgi:hypothetical protein
LCGVDENLVAPNFGSKAAHPGIRVLYSFSRGHVELPSVPWAGNGLSLKLAFAEWPSAMQTGIANGVERTPDICEGDGLSADLDLLDGSDRNVRQLCCFLKGHSSPDKNDSVLERAKVRTSLGRRQYNLASGRKGTGGAFRVSGQRANADAVPSRALRFVKHFVRFPREGFKVYGLSALIAGRAESPRRRRSARQTETKKLRIARGND